MSVTLRITGITLMKNSRICMSGYDIQNNKYYRPIIKGTDLTDSFLHQDNGDIFLFSLVTFEKSNENIEIKAPHIEDYSITGNILDIKNDLNNSEDKKSFFYEISDFSISDVFGDYIDIVDNNSVVHLDYGKRSLGTIVSPYCKVSLDEYGNARVNFKDQTGYQLSNVKCVAYHDVYRKVGEYNNIPVRISLSRAWNKPGHNEYYYYIQVSGVFP